jgi:hypothetical protein
MKKIKLDEFVGQLRPDPKNVEPFVILKGFVGASSEEKHIRLYTDDSLNHFVEIPEYAVLHSEVLSKDVSPLGGSKLWLKSSAELTYGNPNAENRPKSSFLEGDVMKNYQAFGNQAAAGNAAQAQAIPTFGGVCQTLRTGCDNTFCQSYLIFNCPTITRSLFIGECSPNPEVGGNQNFAAITYPTGGFTRTRDFYCPPRSFVDYCPQTSIGVCPDTIANAAQAAPQVAKTISRVRNCITADYYCPTSYDFYCTDTNAAQAAPQAGAAALVGKSYLNFCRSYDFYCPQTFRGYCPTQSFDAFCPETLTVAQQAAPNAAAGVQPAAITRSRTPYICSLVFACPITCGGVTIVPTIPTGDSEFNCTFYCTQALTPRVPPNTTTYYGTFNPYA